MAIPFREAAGVDRRAERHGPEERRTVEDLAHPTAAGVSDGRVRRRAEPARRTGCRICARESFGVASTSPSAGTPARIDRAWVTMRRVAGRSIRLANRR